MRQIGHIERLQVQLGSLKKGTRPNQIYDPTALHVVPAMRLTSKGVIGLLDGRELLDVHHADHESSKNRHSNGISINFGSHYDRMRERFGPNLETGCAGENILVAAEAVVEPNLVSRGLVIETGEGDQVHLTRVSVAHPCRSFSTYVLSMERKPTQGALKETLRFLDRGTRGFYCEWEGEPVVVRPGDKVYVYD